MALIIPSVADGAAASWVPRARHCARTLSTTGMPHSGCTSRSRTTPHRAQVFALPTMLWSRQVTEVVGHIMGVRKPWRRHVAPRRTPGTVQRALLDGPKGQNLSLGPKKIFLLIRWSQSTRRSLSLKGLVKIVYRAFILSVGKISAAVGLRNLSSFVFE